jgi:phosphoribosylglycinamide formyltransferase-1
MKRLVLFASGNGSNVENIIKYFNNKPLIQVVEIFSNNKNAKVLNRAQKYNIPTVVFDKKQLQNGTVLKQLKSRKLDLIILAGFLLKIPKKIINIYNNKIINIHPSLLPLYGGKGMYGLHVHQKVFESKDKQSGITIHFVNHHYDDGAIIFQAKCPLKENIKPKEIAKKVHKLEMQFFPKIIEKILNGQN